MAQSIKNLSLFPGEAGSRPDRSRFVPQSADTSTNSRESRLWLAVCLHDLVFEASRLAGSHEPAVVADIDDAHVAAANSAARALGVNAGCALNAALAMAESLRVEPRDTGREQQAVRSLAMWARTLTPTVSIAGSNILLIVTRMSEGSP